MKKIVVVGSLNMDMSARVKCIPTTGETTMGSNLVMVPGGKGENQACTVGKLGGNVVMLGSIGNDEAGRRIKKELDLAGVDTEKLRISSRESSGTAWICVDREGNNSIIVLPGANDCCNEGYIATHRRQIEECDCLLVQLEIPLKAVILSMRIAHEAGKYVILNPAPAKGEMPEEVFRMADLITPNETELFLLTGNYVSNPTQEDIEKQAGRILGRGAGEVLVTLGEKGSMLAQGRKRTIFPALKVEAVDTTGAGDCFNGALAVALTEGKSMEAAIRFASAAAALSVQKNGAQSSIPERGEVEALCNIF